MLSWILPSPNSTFFKLFTQWRRRRRCRDRRCPRRPWPGRGHPQAADHAPGSRRRRHRHHRAPQPRAERRGPHRLRRSPATGPGRPAGRPLPGRALPDQGPGHARGGLAPHLGQPLCPEHRRPRGWWPDHPLPPGRRHPPGQDQHPGIRHHRHDRERPPGPLPQSLEPRPHRRGLLGRIGGRCGLGHGPHGPRQRRPGLDPHPCRLLRPGGPEGHPGPDPQPAGRLRLRRRLRGRPRGHPHGARQRRHDGRHRYARARQSLPRPAQGGPLPGRGGPRTGSPAHHMVIRDRLRPAHRPPGPGGPGAHRRSPAPPRPRRGRQPPDAQQEVGL